MKILNKKKLIKRSDSTHNIHRTMSFFTTGGFTLVETLVAISILSLSIVATFTAVQNGLQNSSTAKDQTTAFYLAQEAMEFIKNKRDENALNSIFEQTNPVTTWLDGMSSVAADPCWFGVGGFGQKTCAIDVTVSSPSDVISCGTSGFGNCSNLNQNSTTGLFGYTSGAGWNQTIFKREIQFQEIPSNVGKEVKVTIRMSWTSRWGQKSFEVTESLFNRQ